MDILTDSREDPTPRPQRRFARRLGRGIGRGHGLAVVAIVAGLALGATGVALAQNGGSSTPSVPGSAAALRTAATATPTPPSGGELRGHMGLRGMRGFGPGMAMFGAAGAPLHGEFVVPKTGGGYQTVVFQRGKVTAVSATAITLKSDDGVSQTFTVTSDTLVNAARDGISTIKKDATATVSATKSGSTLTAVSVSDKSLLDAMRKRFGDRHGDGPGDLPTPKPSATGSST